MRGADTSRPDLTPQCEGLLAISYGLSANYPDDHEMLKHGMVIYDALYTWCRLQAQITWRKERDAMSLKIIGTIEIPDSDGSSFDHGAFDPKTRRIFVAHTGRDCVEVIDHERGNTSQRCRDFQEAAGVVADDGLSWSQTAGGKPGLG